MAWKNPTPAELAADWIASRKDGADEDTSGHLAQFLLVGFPEEEPELTWETIRLVMQAYPESDFYAAEKTEAQTVCGLLAAGPVEDLLSFHGPLFIQGFEEEARRDRRMAWLLGGAWQFQMTDEIWQRVQLAADNSYWTRSASPEHAAAIVPLLRARDRQATIVSMDDGRMFTVFNITWGLDDGADYEHVTTNISPNIDGAAVDFFNTGGVTSVTDPETGQLLWSRADGS